MIITEEIREKWKRLQETGDIAELMSLCKASDTTISNALNNGKCALKHFKVIRAFYLKREKEVKKLLQSA